MTDAAQNPRAIDGVLIASGKYHDIDFARLELEQGRGKWLQHYSASGDEAHVAPLLAAGGMRVFARGCGKVGVVELPHERLPHGSIDWETEYTIAGTAARGQSYAGSAETGPLDLTRITIGGNVRCPVPSDLPGRG